MERLNRRVALDEAEDAAFFALKNLAVGPAELAGDAELMAIAYVSTAARTLAVQDLESLLAAARARNETYQISGMLLYDDAQFLQYLEGPAPHVGLIWRIIRTDPLHHHVVKLLRKEPVQRMFADWRMAFQPGLNRPGIRGGPLG